MVQGQTLPSVERQAQSSFRASCSASLNTALLTSGTGDRPVLDPPWPPLIPASLKGMWKALSRGDPLGSLLEKHEDGAESGCQEWFCHSHKAHTACWFFMSRSV